MSKLTFIDPNGQSHEIDSDGQRSFMQVALDNNVPGLLGDCGGACSCATCHGIVETAWLSQLPPPSESEAFMLETVADRQPGSRLCCQLRLTPELDGLVVRLPAEQG